jgi:acyl dehydratase
VSSKRPLKSRPGWGIIETQNFAETLDGTRVMEFESAVLVQL